MEKELDQDDIDFFEWVKSIEIPEVEHFITFDPKTGKILGLYPSHSLPDVKNYIKIDKDIADAISQGQKSLTSYVVDLSTDTPNLIEVQTLVTIDDVLHRIIDKKSHKNDLDLIIKYNKDTKELIFSLDKKYRTKTIFYDGNTELIFYLTEYNDPHKLIKKIKFPLEDLFNSNVKIFKDIDVSYKFNIFTRRIFKNYILET